jgi:hypothetical protein
MRNSKGLKSLAAAALIAASFLTISTQSSQAVVRVVAAPVGSSATGLWGTGSIVGVASFLVIYDLIRRTTCSGDFLKLGGPGFTQPIGRSENVLVPRRCPAR